MGYTEDMKNERNNHIAALKRTAREDYVAALRDGRKMRATTFASKSPKEVSRKACRGKVTYD